SIVNEVRGARRRKQIERQIAWTIEIACERQRLVDEVSRLAAAEVYVARLQLGLDERVHEPVVVYEAACLAAISKDPRELFHGWRFAIDLILNTSEERFVHEVAWPQVRGKHHEDDEGQLEFLARPECEVVHPAFER